MGFLSSYKLETSLCMQLTNAYKYVFDVQGSVIGILRTVIDRLLYIETFDVTHSSFHLVMNQCVCLLD